MSGYQREWFAQRLYRSVALYLVERNFTGDKIAKPIEFEFVEDDHASEQPPTLLLSYDGGANAQGLMDALWDVGIRPSNHPDAPPVIAAIKEHLADMRKIAFKALDLDEEKK